MCVCGWEVGWGGGVNRGEGAEERAVGTRAARAFALSPPTPTHKESLLAGGSSVVKGVLLLRSKVGRIAGRKVSAAVRWVGGRCGGGSGCEGETRLTTHATQVTPP